MKKISLNFDGYWSSESSMPTHAGIYCVYRGVKGSSGVTFKQLLYVGEAINVRERLEEHERKPDWKKRLQYGEGLWFSTAPIGLDRERAEAAIIFHHKPVENTEYNNSFPHPETELELNGQTSLLDRYFIVRSTTQKSYLSSENSRLY